MRSSGEVQAVLEGILGYPIESLRRVPYAYGTSSAIDALEAQTPAGAVVRLLLKDLGGAPVLARSVKPAFLRDPLREIEVYREILGPRRLGTAHCYGSVVDPDQGRHWLLLEHVPGVELWQIGELSIWQEAARWLAQLHETCREVKHPRLLQYDRGFYERWLHRALAVSRDPRLQPIAAGFPTVIDRLLALPVTLIHNEFYPSNVLIERRGTSVRVCPVDWEMAARGPALIDLAALTAGKWSGQERSSIVTAYVEARQGSMDTANLRSELACCRLVLALRWLGWSQEWEPPPEHAQDWVRVAVAAAAEAGIS